MKISEIGGEFALIDRLMSREVSDPAIIKGVGDDCAVLEYTADRYLVVTTDMMVENSHFASRWFTPYQVGRKLMEVNVSDVVAMGGVPRFAFISVALTRETEVEYMDELYRGIYASGRTHGVHLIGGDTTHGSEIVLNLTLIGEVEKGLLCLRRSHLRHRDARRHSGGARAPARRNDRAHEGVSRTGMPARVGGHGHRASRKRNDRRERRAGKRGPAYLQ